MLSVTLDEKESIAVLSPEGRLSERDFQSAAAVIDPYIERAGSLNGLIIHVQSFPGWDSFASFVTHLQFIRDHHRRLSHVALVTDSPLGQFGEQVANHFINAEVKNFPFNELATAKAWIAGDKEA